MRAAQHHPSRRDRSQRERMERQPETPQTVPRECQQREVLESQTVWYQRVVLERHHERPRMALRERQWVEQREPHRVHPRTAL